MMMKRIRSKALMPGVTNSAEGVKTGRRDLLIVGVGREATC